MMIIKVLMLAFRQFSTTVMGKFNELKVSECWVFLFVQMETADVSKTAQCDINGLKMPFWKFLIPEQWESSSVWNQN